MEKKVLNFDEACQYTGYAKSYLYKLTADNIIPHSKPNGRKIFFDKEKLDNWLLSKPVTTSAQMKQEAANYVTTH